MAALLLRPASASTQPGQVAPPAAGPLPSAPDVRDGGAADAEAPQEKGILIKDAFRRLELRLPAAYWDCYDPEKVAAQAGSGCAGPRTSPNLVFVLNHKDAPANVWCEAGSRPFLMRNEDDLENFVGGFIGAVRAQAGEAMQELESSYARHGGMILHRFSFIAPLRAGGGCAAQQAPPGDQLAMRYLFVHLFVRPKGEDAVMFKVFCAAPEALFQELEPEFEFITSSMRYTGEVAAEFFDPDAPVDKILSAKDAARAVGGAGARQPWLLYVGVIVIIWMVIRRRKKAAA